MQRDKVQKSPHSMYDRRRHKHKNAMTRHVNTLLLLLEQCTGRRKHHLQFATAQVPLQRAPLSCRDVQLASCTAKVFPACSTFSIKIVGSSSHNKLNNGLFTLGRAISKVEITQGSWQLYEDFYVYCR